jgi:hypothetical protein
MGSGDGAGSGDLGGTSGGTSGPGGSGGCGGLAGSGLGFPGVGTGLLGSESEMCIGAFPVRLLRRMHCFSHIVTV